MSEALMKPSLCTAKMLILVTGYKRLGIKIIILLKAALFILREKVPGRAV